MPYDWKIEHNGIDITDKCARFDITADLSQYARELVVTIADPAFYDALDFSVIPEDPALEVFTMVDAAWVSQGKFFIERPALTSSIHEDALPGLWGRSATARLGSPFAPRISRMWDADTSFYAICAEMCAAAGLTWADAQSDIEDFYIFAYTYQAENAFPIDILAELADLAGALVTCDRAGLVRIRAIDYAPSSATATIADDDWQLIDENPQWPDFGNRVRIVPQGSLANYSIRLHVPDACLPADGASRAKVYARVADADGNPVAGEVVSWALEATAASLLYADTNTIETTLPPEELTADNQHQFTLALPPSTVLGVYAYADHARRHNLLTGGHTIAGAVVTLGNPLTYCDQALRVYYRAAGVAVNYVRAGAAIEDVTVSAELDGQRGSADIYIGNGCRGPAALSMDAVPSSIEVGHTAQLIVYAEEGGGPIADGRLVRVWERSALGAVRWATARLGTVRIANAPAEAVNEVAGVSQCDLARFPANSAISIYQADADGNPTGANLYARHNGKTVDLSTVLPTGTTLVAHYTAQGAALNYFVSSGTPGTAHLLASMATNREEPLEAEARIQVSDPADPTSGDTADDYAGGGYGGTGGSDGELDTGFDFGCTLADGSVVQCGDDAGDDWASSKTCCEKGGVVGCWPRSQCDSYQPGLNCVPANVSDNPDAAGDRFDDARAAGCTCEEACAAEYNLYGTTQTHDGGSYRTAREIVEQDQGITYEEGGDNSAYWAAVAAVRQSALDACVQECEATGLPEDCAPPGGVNPEQMAPGQSAVFYIIGSTPPYAWSVVSGDLTLEEPTTDLPSNRVTAGENFCGTGEIRVTDSLGGQCKLFVMSTNGTWELCDEQSQCDGTFGRSETIHRFADKPYLRASHFWYHYWGRPDYPPMTFNCAPVLSGYTWERQTCGGPEDLCTCTIAIKLFKWVCIP